MTSSELKSRLREVVKERLPSLGGGETPKRLTRLLEIGEEDLSLAKLAEAHWDAVAILTESGIEPKADAIYGVWASEIPGRALRLRPHGDGFLLTGSKPFCSGLGIVDRALVTVNDPKSFLFDIDLHDQTDQLRADLSAWQTDAFRDTNTGTITFEAFRISHLGRVGGENFYLNRPGFWQGACGPAACWVGGAAGLVSYAKKSKRSDPHALAHLGAMDAALWMMKSALASAGAEIDALPDGNAMVLALRLRHVVEQACSDILHRLPRAYGPHPLAMDEQIARRYHELDLYLRQAHGERDLEGLGRTLAGKEETAI